MDIPAQRADGQYVPDHRTDSRCRKVVHCFFGGNLFKKKKQIERWWNRDCLNRDCLKSLKGR